MTKGDKLNRLRIAQNSLCAGCGRPIASRKRYRRTHPNAQSFDHVVPRAAGGTRSILNGLLKHVRCNVERGSRAASGCDVIWHFAVLGRLGYMRRDQSPLIVNHSTDSRVFQYYMIRPRVARP